jgi:hypothetical protein
MKKKSFNAMAEGYEFTVQAPDMESSDSKVEVYETPQVLDTGFARTMEENMSENEEERASNFTPLSPFTFLFHHPTFSSNYSTYSASKQLKMDVDTRRFTAGP